MAAALAGLFSLASCAGRALHQTASPAVQDAALPFRVLPARGGAELGFDQFLEELDRARGICIGEMHPNPHHHWAQLYLVAHLSRRNRARGRRTGLGLEMVQRPFQAALDDFAAGRIDEESLLVATEWNRRWRFDYALYRPILHCAVAQGAALIALNMEQELVREVARHGLESLSAADRAALPDMDLGDEEHRAWFDAVMERMGGADKHVEQGKAADAAPRTSRADRIYASQVLWDETMAETAASWLAADGDRQIIMLAGTGHCHDTAIVARLKRRSVKDVVSIRPVLKPGEDDVAELLARPRTDYLFVMLKR